MSSNKMDIRSKNGKIYLDIIVGAASGEETGDRVEITGEYWLGVVPIDLNRSTPHFGFFSEFPSAIVAVITLNENC